MTQDQFMDLTFSEHRRQIFVSCSFRVKQTDRQANKPSGLDDLLIIRRPIALVLRLCLDLLRCWRGNTQLGHTKISILSCKTRILTKKWRGDSQRCSLFYLIYKHCSSLSQWLIPRAFPPCWRLVERPVQQQNLAFSAGAPQKNCFLLSQQKWHLSYLNAFFDWMVINMCRYTCRLSGASWGAEEWDYLIIMTASIMNGDRWLVLTSDPAGNYWTRTKSLIMNLLKPVGLLSWLQLRHI